MAKGKTDAASSSEEFELLVGQLAQEGYHGIPKAMSPMGFEVLAFDLEERDKLARVRAWIKSQDKTRTPKQTDEAKQETEATPDGQEFTPAQQEMDERIRKRQIKVDAGPNESGKKSANKKRRRRPKAKRPKDK